MTPMPMPACRAARCAAAACSAVSHCSQAWNSTRSASARLSSATSAEPGSVSAAGHDRQSGPCTSAIAHHAAQSLDGPAVAGEECVKFGAAARGQRHRADDLECRALGGPHRIPVDKGRGAARGAQRRAQGLDPGPVGRAQPCVFGDVLDAQVERADLAPAHRQVGGRADRRLRLRRVQRVDQHEIRAQLAGRSTWRDRRDRAGRRGPRRRANEPNRAERRSPTTAAPAAARPRPPRAWTSGPADPARGSSSPRALSTAASVSSGTSTRWPRQFW